MTTSPPAGTLISLEAALAALLDGVTPVAPRSVPLERALGCIAAEMPAAASALPVRNIAATDGWACRSLDLIGASVYSPAMLSTAPAWVETGDPMPEECDCVLEADLLSCSGPIAQAVGEAAPGQGVRRMGEDLAVGRPSLVAGRKICGVDLLIARRIGLDQLAVRSPRVRIFDVAAAAHETFSAQLLVGCLKEAGATVSAMETRVRDAASIAAALESEDCDLLLLVGGTGEGRSDVTAEALARRGVLIAHRIALRPGRTSAIGRLGPLPVVALPGLPDQAFAAFLALVLPLLDRLSGRSQRGGVVLPLSRKIPSVIGLSEVVLLGEQQGAWVPLAVGDFSLDTMRLADAWLAVPGESEGYAAGTPVTAFPLRSMM